MAGDVDELRKDVARSSGASPSTEANATCAASSHKFARDQYAHANSILRCMRWKS